ncbi:phosphoglycolate phosphatase [Cohaesibacter celericrescens]|uniref:phosphoglycolate phosphatase n=1 Tax=Cohaesibacter celericrescens TaxID=2067669 RepID=A0A2N5XLI1_9HYPH|nr:phosphoglycolate phosphatase [Cohaesibacter celericrescens]PLW75379.1 phosphoglycolate phosphatase [Cohaesibacter celericrescens]
MAQIVFDLDGTLIDSAPDIRQVANTVLEAEGKGPVSLAQAISFLGSGTHVLVQQMRDTVGIPDSEQDRILKAFHTLYEGAFDLTEPYSGVRSALDTLATQGHGLGICTNKPMRPCRAVLKHLKLDVVFPVVLGGDSLPERKPHPAPLLATFDALGTGQRIYVGDSEVDAETAERAGIPFLLFTQGYRKTAVEDLPHTATFDDFSALPDLIADTLAAAS